MKINGVHLGSAVIISGLLIQNYNELIKETLIGTGIIIIFALGCWHFSFQEDSQSKSNKCVKQRKGERK